MEIVLGGNCESKEALNSLQSLENNPDGDGHIISIHFRVSKVMDCYQDSWSRYCLELLGIQVVLKISRGNLFW